MNKRHLLTAFIVFLISSAFACSAFLWLNGRQPATHTGQLVFASAINYEKNVDKITITTPKESFDLVMQDNYWRIGGAEGYFAGLKLVNDLLTSMTKSVYYSKQPATPELLKQYGLEIKENGAPKETEVTKSSLGKKAKTAFIPMPAFRTAKTSG